jgi:hypothetical protein
MALDLGSEPLLWRARRGSELPAVGRKSNVSEDEQCQCAENNPLSRCEVMPHQILE